MTCIICGNVMKLIPAGVSKKTGKPYDSFMSCPNRCKAVKAQFKTSPQPPQAPTASLNAESVQMIMDEISGLNKRLDDMAHFLVEKLGSDRKDDVNVKDIKF